MQIGDLVRYKHDPSMAGVIVQVNPHRKPDSWLVLWNKPQDGRQQWYVQVDWIEVVNAGR